ncbi:hypothetical protein [Streptomyces rochei]|uniref:hypothetical protein n=1 Tax=Streptomyces rochei TaxID=1928 RepID=UPI00368F7F85
MTGEFERRHGFPPGTNEVRLASRDDQAAARTLAQAIFIPADLVTFYDCIGGVTWADIGNGYFLDPASDVLLRLQDYGAVDLGADQRFMVWSSARTAAACPTPRALMDRSIGRGRHHWTNRSSTR